MCVTRASVGVDHCESLKRTLFYFHLSLMMGVYVAFNSVKNKIVIFRNCSVIFKIPYKCVWASLVVQTVKNLPGVQETWI